jgi:hypothetical protein
MLPVKSKFAISARLLPAFALLACAPHKAIVVEEPSAGPAAEASSRPGLAGMNEPALPDDGIRLPDMLAMPGDGEFRAGRANAPKDGPGAGAVISRPPTDPPSRPKKPKAATSE